MCIHCLDNYNGLLRIGQVCFWKMNKICISKLEFFGVYPLPCTQFLDLRHHLVLPVFGFTPPILLTICPCLFYSLICFLLPFLYLYFLIILSLFFLSTLLVLTLSVPCSALLFIILIFSYIISTPLLDLLFLYRFFSLSAKAPSVHMFPHIFSRYFPSSSYDLHLPTLICIVSYFSLFVWYYVSFQR